MSHRSLYFVAAGLGVAVDWIVFALLRGAGLNEFSRLGAGFLAGALLMALIVLGSAVPAWRLAPRWRPLQSGFRLLLVGVCAFCLGVGTFVSLAEPFACPESLAALAAALVAMAANLAGCRLFAMSRGDAPEDRLRNWQLFGAAIVAYGLLLRLAFAGAVNLIPEEAYYWGYAQHPDIGYLDHPPMVAWMIWLGTRLLGPVEIGVRLPALLCWGVTAYFMARLAYGIAGRRAVVGTLLLVSALPVYFGVGATMTPDAPMYACWAGAIFFLRRALAEQRKGAWLGVGICLGLGMLSKYTIALLAPATLAFVLLDRQSRHWLRRPQPYLALAVAALLFTPVIVWNANNHWASFAFQGSDRWTNSGRFGLHVLIGSAALLLTPFGLIAAVRALRPRAWKGLPAAEVGLSSARARLFMLCYTIVPLSVFAASSLRNSPRVNWTGPIWLAVLPAIGLALSPTMLSRRAFRFCSGGILACMAIYGALLAFIVAGLPGAPAGQDLSLYSAWREFGTTVERIEDNLAQEIGGQPMVVGMHRYSIASELAFYDDDRDGMEEMTGPHLFGRKSLMWAYWRTPEEVSGKTLLLVDFDEGALRKKELEEQFSSLGAVRKEAIRKHGRVVSYFYHRVGYGYEPK